ncbi:MAG: acyl-phosphate glycerol 3-phosphate acyltransferase, partial [Clostridiales bacterium]|nr:acyl-phosphate glycerol 3-phosphate acyltransferase [Clostridiales bacterium]
GYLVALVCMILFGQMGFYGMDAGHRLELYVVMALLTILAYYRHRANIVRLIHGTESKVYLSGSSKKEDGQDSR